MASHNPPLRFVHIASVVLIITCGHLVAAQQDTKIQPAQVVTEETLDGQAARMRPDADKHMTDVPKCAAKRIQQEALSCLAVAESIATEYLRLEKQLWELKAKKKRDTVAFLRSEVTKLENESRTPRNNPAEEWLRPMVDSMHRELRSFEDRQRSGERLSNEDSERFSSLRQTAKHFQDVDKLVKEQGKIATDTAGYRRLALTAYNDLMNDLEALAGLDTSRAGVFEAQAGLTRMFVATERAKIMRSRLEDEDNRPLLTIPPPPGAAAPSAKAAPAPPASQKARTPDDRYADCLSAGSGRSDCEQLRIDARYEDCLRDSKGALACADIRRNERFNECLRVGKSKSECDKLGALAK